MLNRCSMIGRVNRDPQIKETVAGKPMVTFDLTVRDQIINDNVRTSHEHTFRVVVLNPTLVGIASKLVRKGTMLFIEGRLESREIVLPDGDKTRIAEIVLGHQRAQMLVQNQYGEIHHAADDSLPSKPVEALTATYA